MGGFSGRAVGPKVEGEMAGGGLPGVRLREQSRRGGEDCGESEATKSHGEASPRVVVLDGAMIAGVGGAWQGVVRG